MNMISGVTDCNCWNLKLNGIISWNTQVTNTNTIANIKIEIRYKNIKIKFNKIRKLSDI